MSSFNNQIKEVRKRIELDQQTLAALETLTVGGIPDGHVLEYMDCGEWTESGFVSVGQNAVDAGSTHYRLRKLPDPPKPRKVPLEFDDVPPGSVFSFNPSAEWFAGNIKRKGIRFESNGSFVSFSWEEMQSVRLYIHRPGIGDWQLCEKDAE